MYTYNQDFVHFGRNSSTYLLRGFEVFECEETTVMYLNLPPPYIPSASLRAWCNDQ